MTGGWFIDVYDCFTHFNIYIYILLGGLEHESYDFPYIGNVIIPTDFHIFQRGRSTTNQYIYIYIHNIIWYNMNIQWRQRPWRHVFVDGLVRWKDLAISSKKTDKTCHLICLSPSSRWVHSSNLISINLSCDVQCLMTMGSEWLYKNAAFVSQSISSWVVQKIVEVVDG